jgi:oligopeptide transport system substrate-binding protein
MIPRPRTSSAARWTLPLLAAALLCGCGRPGPGAPGSSGADILLRGLGTEPDSLDPQKARLVEAQRVLRDICEGLTTLDRAGRVAPGIATAWTVSADGRIYTFTLRHDARWSDGEPVVAADFVAGLRRLVSPATGSQYAESVNVIENASAIVAGRKPPDSLGVSAPDPWTVVIGLETPAPYLPALLADPSACPVLPSAVAKYGAGYAQPGHLPSDGAFTLEQWVHGSSIYLQRNRYYWNDAATRLEGVRYLISTDESTELSLYRAGELDMTDEIPRAQYDWIRAHLGAQLHVAPEIGTYYYGFDLRRPPFKGEAGLRRALSMVIDREKLVKLVLRTGELPAYGWIPPGVAGYTPQRPGYAALTLAQRIAAARRLYAAAGYSAARPLRFTLKYNTGEIHAELAVAIASMWRRALGVEVRLRAEDFGSLMQDIGRGEVQMFRSSWLGDYDDPYTFAQYFKSDFGINLPHYDNPAYDALVDRAERQTDPGRREALLERAERLMLHDQPVIPIYFYASKHLVKPRVEGWYDNVMNVVYSRELGLRGASPSAATQAARSMRSRAQVSDFTSPPPRAHRPHAGVP